MGGGTGLYNLGLEGKKKKEEKCCTTSLALQGKPLCGKEKSELRRVDLARPLVQASLIVEYDNGAYFYLPVPI